MQFLSIHRGVALLVALWVGLAAHGVPAAEPGATAPDPAAPVLEQAPTMPAEDLEALIATLEDDQQRAAFLATLRTLLEVQRAQEAGVPPTPGFGTRLLGTLSAGVSAVSREMARFAVGLGRLPELLEDIGAAVDTPDERARLVRGLGILLAVTAVGLLAAWVARRLLAGPRAAVQPRSDAGWMERLGLLAVGLVLALVPPAAFAAAGWAVLPLLGTEGGLHAGLTAFVTAFALHRGVMAVADTLLPADDGGPPRRPALPAETRRYLRVWIQRFSAAAIFGGFMLHAAFLAGLSAQGYGVLSRLLGLLVVVLLVVFILQNRLAVAHRLRPDPVPLPGEPGLRPAQRLHHRLAGVWHVLAILYVLVLYVVWAAGIDGGFAYFLRSSVLTVVAVVLALGASRALRLALDRAFRAGAETDALSPGLQARADRYVPVLHTVLRVVLALVTALVVLEVWGLETLAWLTTGPGRALAGAALSIGVVLVLAFVAWTVVSAAIERYLTQTDGEGNALARSARAKTLLPLARTVFMGLLMIVVGLIVLSEIGVDIAPLLAGAGVIGLAVGFGSQKLVQDVITGAFILFENTISVGDVVNVGGHSGVVEALTIRSLRLRDLSGSVHTIPFSTVDKITNLTKDFSFAVFDVGVAYREDTDAVTEVLKEVGAGMQADPEYGPLILEPLEIFGVDRFADSAVIIKARLKTQPLKQWMVGREFNRRMKKAFDARGIEIPFPHVTLWFGEDKDGQAPPGRLVVRGDRQAPEGSSAATAGSEIGVAEDKGPGSAER